MRQQRRNIQTANGFAGGLNERSHSSFGLGNNDDNMLSNDIVLASSSTGNKKFNF